MSIFPKHLPTLSIWKRKEKPFLERWMWVYLESGRKPEWAHENIGHQDLKDMIATAIRDTLDKE